MFESYVDFINREFQRRVKRNANYSIRAFARDIGQPYQSLAAVLSGKQGISPGTAKKFLPHLNLNELESRLFLDLVSMKHHRSPNERREAAARVEEIRKELEVEVHDSNQYQLVANWIHSALLVLLNVDDFQAKPEWMARRLGISQSEATQAWDNLMAADLIRQDESGRWRQTSSRQSFHSATLSKAHIELYSQLNRIAQEKLTQVPITQRNVSNLFVSINDDDYDYVVQRIRSFRRELMEDLIKRGGGSDRVYSLYLQFFPMTQIDPS